MAHTLVRPVTTADVGESPLILSPHTAPVDQPHGPLPHPSIPERASATANNPSTGYGRFWQETRSELERTGIAMQVRIGELGLHKRLFVTATDHISCKRKNWVRIVDTRERRVKHAVQQAVSVM